MKGKNFLIASSGIFPYIKNNDTAKLAYKIARSANSKGGQIRMFMPRFGTVNERKHQLHEVIRLSGVNVVINDDDMPLIIKVASIPKERMQVYFIDNDEFFKRKHIFTDAEDKLFEDNDGRAVFFAKGIVETVKKLNWRPDYILVFDWFTSLLPLYINTYYKNEPLFHDAKTYVVISDETFKKPMSENLKDKLVFDEIPETFIEKYKEPTEINLLKNAIDLADGVILRTSNVPEEIAKHLEDKDLKVVDLSGIDLDEDEDALKAEVVKAFEEKATSN
jgi:starch synthase